MEEKIYFSKYRRKYTSGYIKEKYTRPHINIYL